MSLTPSDFRQAMGCFATGITVITVDQDGEVHGMTATAGDHTIFVAEVEEVVVRGGEPLLYFRGQYRDIGPVGH